MKLAISIINAVLGPTVASIGTGPGPGPTPPADGIITEASPGAAPFDFVLAENGDYLEQE